MIDLPNLKNSLLLPVNINIWVKLKQTQKSY